MKYDITTFYKFSPLTDEQLEGVEAAFFEFERNSSLCGLIISSNEGLNATVAAHPEQIEQLKSLVRAVPGFQDVIFKDSSTNWKPFRRFRIKRRPEIVTIKRTDFVPKGGRNGHLTPAEWHTALQSGEDYALIDTRNIYETKVGKFEGAIDPEIDMFSEFGEWVTKSGIPKEKKVLMYCTGGIRCEKAILEMQSQGYEQVYQLEGGILKYLEEYPDGKFDGECFVFDHRVAVDSELKPSARFKLCPHCGDPGDLKIQCARCDTPTVICESCAEEPSRRSCSKDCAYHLSLALTEEVEQQRAANS